MPEINPSDHNLVQSFTERLSCTEDNDEYMNLSQDSTQKMQTLETLRIRTAGRLGAAE